MAKTFDNISEASATNYLFLFAQKTLGLQNEAPTPPPLNALGLPCEAMRLLWAWLHPKKVHPEQATVVPVDDQGAMAAEASPSSPPHSPSSEEVTRGEETPHVEGKTLAEKIAPLAEKITEYILDHQDDAAQEDRWRTTMKRDMSKSFKKVKEEVRKVKEEVKAGVQKAETEMQQRFEDVHAKMDETIQLVKDLADFVKQP